ncbi:MAG: acyl-CoA dehydrogenase family protein [Ilumatobacteraceae bacterium]
MSKIAQPGVDLVNSSSALVDTLRERAQQTDEQRQLPDATVADLNALNFVGAGVPEKFGGLGLDMDTIFQATRELARGCGSTAWVAGNCALHNVMVGFFPLEAQQECWMGGAIPPFVGNGFNSSRATCETAPGGYRLTGQWDFGSGIMHSDWNTVAAAVGDDLRLFLVPKEDYEIVDTWHTSGLRGTGSHDVVVKDKFVPGHRSVALTEILAGTAEGASHHSDTFFRVPLVSYVSGGVVSTLFGLALTAIELFEDRCRTTVGGLSGVVGSTRPENATNVAKAAAQVDAAQKLFWSDFDEMRESVLTGDALSLDSRARFRRDFAYCGDLCAEVVNRLYGASGAHTLQFDNPMNRVFRDTNAGCHHYGIARDPIFQAYGRIRFGLDPEYAMI